VTGPLIPLQRTAFSHFDDMQFSAWAAEKHAQSCSSCRAGEQCRRGQMLAELSRRADDDIPGYAA